MYSAYLQMNGTTIMQKQTVYYQEPHACHFSIYLCLFEISPEFVLSIGSLYNF